MDKSSQHDTPTYEVSNLIDDYKKVFCNALILKCYSCYVNTFQLIRQSAMVTKRPATHVILDLIQRSNKCVPNCRKMESSIDDLRNDLQTFLTSYAQKISPSFINTASLTVPPSLMDELKAATERF